MDEDRLTAAYDRLGDALDPPRDAAALVVARLGQRRQRRRATLAVAGAAVAVAAITGVATTFDESDTPAIGTPTSSPATQGPTPVPPSPTLLPGDEPVRPADLEELTCPGADRRIGTVANPEAYVGRPYGPETVEPWLLPEADYAFYRIDEDQIVARLTRQNGEVYAALGLRAIGNRWRVESIAACTSAFPGLGDARVVGSGLPLVSFVAVQVGHCWVETLDYDGRAWDLRDADQFGWGGLGPDGFLAVGSAELTADGGQLDYVDLSGARLTFVPADRPGTEANQGGCA